MQKRISAAFSTWLIILVFSLSLTTACRVVGAPARILIIGYTFSQQMGRIKIESMGDYMSFARISDSSFSPEIG